MGIRAENNRDPKVWMLLPVLLIALLCSSPFAIDVIADRQHTIAVRSALNVYRNPEPYWRGTNNPVIATVKDSDEIKVRRIRYGKDYMVIQVRLSDGRCGYVFYDDNFDLL